MLLTEFFKKEPGSYQDLSQDNGQVELGDLRKSRLTLRQLNKLRRMNDVRTFEQTARVKDVQRQYAAKPAA